MITKKILLLCFLTLITAKSTHKKTHKKSRKLKGGKSFGKKKKKEDATINELDNEKEYVEFDIDFENPRANVEAVHITLGDYFNNRESPNIYRVGFLLKAPRLREFLALKLLIPRKNKLPKIELGKVFEFFNF